MMTYFQSSHGHDNSIINGIGRIGSQWGGRAALWNDETMADEFVKQANEYLTARKKDEPFFLYYSTQDIHVPRAPHPRFKGKSQPGYRGDTMVQLDWAAGEILRTLEDQGFKDNTIVIFSSDNGPVYDDGYEDGTTVHTSTKEVDRGHDASGPYRGGKYQIYEGGTRVPFLIRWPGHVKPGKSDALVNQIDFIASFAELLEIPLAASDAIDRRSTLDAFLGQNPKGHTEMIEEAGKLALRRGDWKFVDENRKKAGGELYDLDTDVAEQKKVIGKHPDIAGEMRDTLERWVETKERSRKLSASAK